MCRRKILLAVGLVFPLLAACGTSRHQAVSSTSSVASDSVSPTYNQVFIAANSCQLKLQPVGAALQQVGADFLATPTDTAATSADIKTLLDQRSACTNPRCPSGSVEPGNRANGACINLVGWRKNAENENQARGVNPGPFLWLSLLVRRLPWHAQQYTKSWPPVLQQPRQHIVGGR